MGEADGFVVQWDMPRWETAAALHPAPRPADGTPVVQVCHTRLRHERGIAARAEGPQLKAFPLRLRLGSRATTHPPRMVKLVIRYAYTCNF